MYCTCQKHVCSSSYHRSKFKSHMSDSDDYTFSLPQNFGKHMDSKKFFFTTKERILETTFCQVFITIK